MNNTDEIKIAVKKLFDKTTDIHVDVISRKPKIRIENAPARIVGVYKNLFTIEVNEDGLKKADTVRVFASLSRVTLTA